MARTVAFKITAHSTAIVGKYHCHALHVADVGLEVTMRWISWRATITGRFGWLNSRSSASSMLPSQ
jgi:hypothetical protein